MSSIGRDIDCQDHAFERIQITHTPRVHSILGELSPRCHSRLSPSSQLCFFCVCSSWNTHIIMQSLQANQLRPTPRALVKIDDTNWIKSSHPLFTFLNSLAKKSPRGIYPYTHSFCILCLLWDGLVLVKRVCFFVCSICIVWRHNAFTVR